jgi:predicted ABC-type ATPase
MFMIAGPNGAGKSTLYELRIKPNTKAPFINADIIQREELKDVSMHASYKAAEMAETRRQQHLLQQRSFVSESTFSHPSKLKLIEDAQLAGFRVVLYHVNLRSPELSVKRVAHRFNEGGHDVPEDKIRDRFERNPALIRQAVLRADRAFIYDNSRLNQDPALAIEFKNGQVARVSDQVPLWARDLYAKELEAISPNRLNAAAASFADARAIAEKLNGSQVPLRIPEVGELQATRGKMVGETSLHWLQQVRGVEFVAHFKSALQMPIALQADYKVTYLRKGVGTVEPWEPKQARADAFRKLPPEQGIAQFPELAKSYAAFAAVSEQAERSTEDQKQRAFVLRAVKEKMAIAIEKGQLPEVVAKAQKQGPER